MTLVEEVKKLNNINKQTEPNILWRLNIFIYADGRELQEIAKEWGMCPATLTFIMQGKRTLKLQQLIDLCNVLNISILELLKEPTEKEIETYYKNGDSV